jgi:arylsulfatase A-like enzyme
MCSWAIDGGRSTCGAQATAANSIGKSRATATRAAHVAPRARHRAAPPDRPGRFGIVLIVAAALLAGCSRAEPVGDASALPTTSQRLVSSIEDLDRAMIDNESRYVLRGPSQTFDLTVPASASFEVGFGVLDKLWRHGLLAVALEATFVGEDGVERVLLRATQRKPKEGENAWHDLTIPLAAVAGRRGSLHLSAHATEGVERASGGLVWTNPRLVAPGERSTGAPNIVLISIDTLRADHLGCYGSVSPTSPAIDRIARAGILFRNATAASSWTLPSHASLLTGLEPSRHGAVHFGFTTPIPQTVRTLAEQLWTAGFATAAFTDGFFVSASLGFDQGFDRFRGPTRLATEARENLGLALQWMVAQRQRPMFVFVHTYEAHVPYVPPPPYDTMFDPGYEGPFAHAFTYDDYLALKDTDQSKDPKIIRHLQALYDGGIRHIDDAVGDFMAGLERTGLAENTCVVLTSDHGEEFEEHGDLLHNRAKLFQELLHVPLIVWCPSRFPAPHEVEQLVGHVDVTPTILDVAGVAQIDGVDGRSLLGALAGKHLTDDRTVRSEVDGSVEDREGTAVAVREDRYKLIRSTVDGGRALFDLSTDPHEIKDLTSDLPEIDRRLEAALPVPRNRNGVASSAPQAVDLPREATQERLRALGYVLPK